MGQSKEIKQNWIVAVSLISVSALFLDAMIKVLLW